MQEERAGEPDPVLDLEALSNVEESSRLSRVGIWAGKLLLLAGLSAGAGLATAATMPTEVELGPHRAEATLTFDAAATLDFGAPGAIIKPLEASGPLGARLEIKEIPVGQEDLAGADFTSEDAEEYARLFANYKTDVEGIRSALLAKTAKGSAVGAIGILGLYGLLGRRRRDELADKGREISATRSFRTAVAVGIIASTFAPNTVSSASTGGVAVSEAFDGTILEGAQIKGKILQVLINKYGTQVLEYIEANDAFYDEVRTNLLREADRSYGILRPSEDEDVLLFYSDLHCNIGMASIINETAKIIRPRLIVSGGDDTMSGTELEEQCLRPLLRNLRETKAVVSPGNHDSNITEQQFISHGFRVLDGEVEAVDGYSILGDDDPRRSVFGQEIRQERGETIDEMNGRLAGQACRDYSDILVVHDPLAGEGALLAGCTNLVLSGHSHREAVTTTDSYGRQAPQIVAESAGGAEREKPTLGPLQTEARIYLVRLDKGTRRPTAMQAVLFGTDARVNFEPPQYFSTGGGYSERSSGPRPQ